MEIDMERRNLIWSFIFQYCWFCNMFFTLIIKIIRLLIKRLITLVVMLHFNCMLTETIFFHLMLPRVTKKNLYICIFEIKNLNLLLQ